MSEKLKIVWTDQAKESLQIIIQYYREYSDQSAKAFAKRVLNKTKSLAQFPGIGPVQEFPSVRRHTYRFLIEGNFKILYYLQENLVFIADVFDTRQDPEKMGQFH